MTIVTERCRKAIEEYYAPQNKELREKHEKLWADYKAKEFAFDSKRVYALRRVLIEAFSSEDTCFALLFWCPTCQSETTMGLIREFSKISETGASKCRCGRESLWSSVRRYSMTKLPFAKFIDRYFSPDQAIAVLFPYIVLKASAVPLSESFQDLASAYSLAETFLAVGEESFAEAKSIAREKPTCCAAQQTMRSKA